MYGLYFIREFYKSAQTCSAYAANTAQNQAQQPEALSTTYKPNHSVACAQLALVAYHPEIREVKKPQAQVNPATVAPSETKPAAEPAQTASPLSNYLQRLSVEGEHAFGIWDDGSGFSLFSANFERVTGLSTGTCAGHDWIYMINHNQQYNVNEALHQAQYGHDGRCLVQARSPDDDADWRWLMIDVKAPKAAGHHTMVLFRDLSEQKALEETLRQTEAALAMSDRGRSAFLSSMSHELRTPLNAIMGFSQMMKGEVLGEMENKTYAEYAKHIHDSGNTLLTKINALLDIASMDAGALALDESEFQLYALLAEAIEIHSHHAFARSQTIKLDCAANIEIRADRAKLLCATSHLLANALRHSANGENVTVCVRIQPDDGIIISVRDAGEGIPTAQLSIIREALIAEDTYYNIEGGGIGLGLSLTKELTQHHEGRVMIDSVRHRGTVVSMILPTSRILNGMPKRRPSLVSDNRFELVK